MTARGRFITVEGIDGAGKSSHIAGLCALAALQAPAVRTTREPGGTPAGDALREVVLHHAMPPLAELLVMFAARRAHVEQVIEPALAAGEWVVCDRFSDASYAYQSGGRGLPRAAIATLEALVHRDLQPDATFLFDIDPAVARERQRTRERAPDRFEREQAAFFERVRAAYLERAREHPTRIHVIDASAGLDAVRLRVAEAFRRAFP